MKTFNLKSYSLKNCKSNQSKNYSLILSFNHRNTLTSNFKKLKDQPPYSKEIPLEVIDFIDKGESPDSFILNMIETIEKEGDLMNCKEDLLNLLKNKLK
jgi:hypothetical protein